MLVMVCSISSPVFTACELISNDRCVVIRSISDETGSTLDGFEEALLQRAQAVLAGVAKRWHPGGIGLADRGSHPSSASLRD